MSTPTAPLTAEDLDLKQVAESMIAVAHWASSSYAVGAAILALISQVETLTAERDADKRLLVPNPCVFCGGPITGRDGSFVGAGDGSMKGGGQFAHRLCHEIRERKSAEAERDEARRIMRQKIVAVHALEDLSKEHSDKTNATEARADTLAVENERLRDRLRQVVNADKDDEGAIGPCGVIAEMALSAGEPA